MITPLGSRLGLLILVTPHMAANNSICSTLFGLLHSVHRWPRVSVSFDPQVHPQRCRYTIVGPYLVNFETEFSCLP
jgi:hypothetical protein